jgi:peptide/nickel transport system ATP-binding protein
VFGLLGPNGAGKTTLLRVLATVIPPSSGSVRLLGRDPAAHRERREIRRRLGYLPQQLGYYPNFTVFEYVEYFALLKEIPPARASRAAARAVDRVHLGDRARAKLRTLSGGMLRRVGIAQAIVNDPGLLLLDEPTAGLDPATRHQLVQRIGALARTRGFALIVISHDLPDAAAMATRTMMLYAGEVMEEGTTTRVIAEPAHPYSWALVNTYPVMTTTKDLRPIRGLPPDPRAVPPGCPYHPRCTQAEAVCVDTRPELVRSRDRLVFCHFGGLKTLLAARDVTKSFGRGRQAVPALAGVSISVQEGESVGIVGPSGSGKSTLARILAAHLAMDSGEVLLEGEALPTTWRGTDRLRRRRIQLVMQDPADALSPRLTVEALVREPLDVAGDGDGAQHRAAVAEALESVGLPSTGSFLQARTHELSGGQLQRIALARALVAGPKLLVADEPTAMLDASEQARLLVVLRERQVEMGLGLVLISHDLAVVRKMTDRVVVLDAGRVVEEGSSAIVSTTPSSATARLLLEASPAFPAGQGDGQP